MLTVDLLQVSDLELFSVSAALRGVKSLSDYQCL